MRLGSILTLDFETKDPYLSDKVGMGGGWCFKEHFTKILGCGLKENDKEIVFERSTRKVINRVAKADTLIGHNSHVYDFGYLLKLGCNLKGKTLIDTKLISKVVNNETGSSLGELAQVYLGEKKETDKLQECAIEMGIASATDVPKTLRDKTYQNLDLIQVKYPEVVASYGIKDIDLTYRLFLILIEQVSDEWIKILSNVTHLLLNARWHGVRFDITKAFDIEEELSKRIITASDELVQYLDGVDSFNPRSSKQVGAILDKFGIKYNLTAKGQPQIKQKWLLTQTHPICNSINNFIHYSKIRDDFVVKPIRMARNGCLHPESSIFGATATGRFNSCSPNIQNIPKRDEELCPLVRGLFIPRSGKTWYKIDYASQEPRLQTHYASLIRARGAGELVLAYRQDPNLSIHDKVVSLTGLAKKFAKAINLGISYGMGNPKLAIELGLFDAAELGVPIDVVQYWHSSGTDEEKALVKNTTWYKETVRMRNTYNKLCPYLSDLAKKCTEAMEKNGYIITILGRRIYSDGKDYKALNKLIQGSAADQLLKALSLIYEEGFSILFSVHDEVDFEIEDKRDALRIKEIMEHAIELKVPVVAEMTSGKNWGEC